MNEVDYCYYDLLIHFYSELLLLLVLLVLHESCAHVHSAAVCVCMWEMVMMTGAYAFRRCAGNSDFCSRKDRWSWDTLLMLRNQVDLMCMRAMQVARCDIYRGGKSMTCWICFLFYAWFNWIIAFDVKTNHSARCSLGNAIHCSIVNVESHHFHFFLAYFSLSLSTDHWPHLSPSSSFVDRSIDTVTHLLLLLATLAGSSNFHRRSLPASLSPLQRALLSACLNGLRPKHTHTQHTRNNANYLPILVATDCCWLAYFIRPRRRPLQYLTSNASLPTPTSGTSISVCNIFKVNNRPAIELVPYARQGNRQ